MSFCRCLLYSVCLSVSNIADHCLEWLFRAWWGNLRQQFCLQKRSSSRLVAGRRSKCRRLWETIDLAGCLSCRKCCESRGGRKGAWTSLSIDVSDHKEITALFSAWLSAAESWAVAWRWNDASQSCRQATWCMCCFLLRSADKIFNFKGAWNRALHSSCALNRGRKREAAVYAPTVSLLSALTYQCYFVCH